MKVFLLLLLIACWAASLSCSGSTANQPPKSNTSTVQSVVPMGRPQKIIDMMKARGEQDLASPLLKVLEPADGAKLTSSTVKVRLELTGDLKGYMPGMNEETHTGNHIHVILDDQAYEAYYNFDKAFELLNVSDGPHILRVFPSRPWHESYKNDGAFQLVKFTVKNGGADNSKPVTASNANSAISQAAAPEAKEMKPSTAGAVDPKKPLLTYSRPKGEYKGADGDMVMLDFWVSNTDLSPTMQKKVGVEPCPCKVRYSIDGGTPTLIFQWAPVWLSGFTPGKHTIRLELIGRDGNVIENGGLNSTEREITIAK